MLLFRNYHSRNFMKKIILSSILLTSSLLAVELSDSYVGGGLGFLATNSDGTNGLGVNLRVGAKIKEVPIEGFGVQTELVKSIIEPKSYGLQTNVLTMAAYTTYDIAVADTDVVLRPKIGLILPNAADDIDSRDVILSSGFGAKYAYTKEIDITADYTVLGERVSLYTLGVEYKF